jgi:hypothetical protein
LSPAIAAKAVLRPWAGIGLASSYCFCFDLVPKSLQRIVLELIKPALQCAETFRIDFIEVFPSLSVFAYQASFFEDLEML